MLIALVIVSLIAVGLLIALVWMHGQFPPGDYVVIPPAPPGHNDDPGDLSDGGQVGEYPPDPGTLPPYTP